MVCATNDEDSSVGSIALNLVKDTTGVAGKTAYATTKLVAKTGAKGVVGIAKMAVSVPKFIIYRTAKAAFGLTKFVVYRTANAAFGVTKFVVGGGVKTASKGAKLVFIGVPKLVITQGAKMSVGIATGLGSLVCKSEDASN